MSEWIKVYTAVFSNPKTVRLARRLDIPPAAAVGHLASLWSWAQEYAPEGDLSGFDPEEIEIAAGWSGPDGSFIDAAVNSRYLDRVDVGLINGLDLRIHDWDVWGGPLVKKRVHERERQRQRRSSAISPQDVHRTHSGHTAADKTDKTDKTGETPSSDELTLVLGEQELTDDYEIWWTTYGRVGTKSEGLPLYKHWRRDGAAREDLMLAATAYRRYCITNSSKQAHARTFLAKSPNRWREWAEAEEHGPMDPSATRHLNDVLEAGAQAFGLTGGDDARPGIDDGSRPTGSVAGGADARRGLPAGQLASRQ